MAQKKLPPSADAKRSLIEVGYPQLSVRRQCELLGLNRSRLYSEAAAESQANLRRIDRRYTDCPFCASRRMTAWLVQRGEEVHRKRVQRLLRLHQALDYRTPPAVYGKRAKKCG